MFFFAFDWFRVKPKLGGGHFPTLRYSDEETERLLAQVYASIPPHAGQWGTHHLKHQKIQWAKKHKQDRIYKDQQIKTHECHMAWQSCIAKECQAIHDSAEETCHQELEYQKFILHQWAIEQFVLDWEEQQRAAEKAEWWPSLNNDAFIVDVSCVNINKTYHYLQYFDFGCPILLFMLKWLSRFLPYYSEQWTASGINKIMFSEHQLGSFGVWGKLHQWVSPNNGKLQQMACALQSSNWLNRDQSCICGILSEQRVREDELEEIFQGNCLSQIIHYITSLRLWHPETTMLYAKAYFKSTYCRTTLHGDTATECIITNDKLAILGFHLTFVGKPALQNGMPTLSSPHT